MLTKALRQLDEGFARATPYVLRTLAWPVLIAVALGSAVFSYRHQGQLGLVATNKLPQPARVEALWHFAVAALLILAVYGVAAAVVRWRSGCWQTPRVLARVNRALAFVMAAPFAAILLTPNIESKSPKLALFYIAIAGACCVPSFMMLGRPDTLDEPEPSVLTRRMDRVWDVVALVLVALMFVAYGWFFTRIAVNNHQAFVTRTIDLGYYDNIFYQSIHGRPLDCTLMQQGNHVAAHFDPILVLLSPLYLLYPRAELLLGLQSFWLAAGVLPAYLLGRHVLSSRVAGVVMAAVYALHPALHGANMYEFHSLTLITPLVLFLLYFLETERKKSYWVTLILLLLVREDVPLLMCFVAVSIILSGRRGYARLGWMTILVSLAYFAMAKLLVLHSSDLFNEGSPSYGFAYYFRDMIPNKHGVRGMLISLVTNPTFVVSHVLSEEKVEFLLKMFLPLALLPLWARPRRFLLVYGLVFTLLASRKPVFTTHFQYAMLLLPFLVGLTPIAIRRLRDGRAPALLGVAPDQLATGLVGLVLVTSVLTSWKFGGIIENTSFRGGFSRVVRQLNDAQREKFRKVHELAAKMEPGAGVTTTNSLGPHVSNRPHVYLYRQARVKESHYVFVDERELKGKRKEWHQRRIRRGELELLDGFSTIKLYRYHPDKQQTGAKDDGKAEPAKPGDKRAPARPTPGKAGPNGEPGEIEDDRGDEESD